MKSVQHVEPSADQVRIWCANLQDSMLRAVAERRPIVLVISDLDEFAVRELTPKRGVWAWLCRMVGCWQAAGGNETRVKVG